MKRLEGKIAWVVGGTSGIGEACARRLAEEGATVVISGRRRDRLEALAASIPGADAEPCDVTDEASIAGAVEAIASRHGGLDLALANAGFTVGGAVAELSGDDWRRQLDTNVVGAALTARHALPRLRERRGRLALTGSVAAFMPAPYFAAYHASKHALRALGLTLAAELEGSGVSCTLLHPGFVASEINQVDNLGRRDPAREDVRPQLLMWSAERAAKVMVNAMIARRREVVFTGHGKLAAFVGQHAPRLMQAILGSSAMRGQAASFRVED
ncbi:MAG: SDR family NAD(P)-dependent oxidoreductase [Myxococcales bacterium]|nr:SDR family NAD(P)-dependent oxidoreductase [Myxococcales bacterium]